MSERVSPHSIEAERAVLGAVLVDQDRVFDVRWLRPTDFFRDAHQTLWRTFLTLAEHSKPIDLVTVRQALGPDVEAVGGAAYLAALTDGVPRSSNVEFYGRIVQTKALLRSEIAVARQLLEAAHDDGADPREVLNEAQRALVALTQHNSGRGLVSAEQAVQDVMPLVERILEQKSSLVGLATGFAGVDRLTRGLRAGDLVLLAARPSMGKTSFAGNVSERVSGRGDTVAFFSLEMSRDDVMLRLLASSARVDFHRFMSGYLNQTDFSTIGAAMTTIGRYALHVDDSSSPTLLDLSAQCRRLAVQSGLALVIVDYLQLMPMPRAENRNVAVSELSRGLKHLARELRVPVLALSQLSREVERRGDKRPMLSDLRDSGALEQDADQVWFIHRPEVYEQTPENAGRAELIVAKSRNGPTGTVELTWRANLMRFEDAA